MKDFLVEKANKWLYLNEDDMTDNQSPEDNSGDMSQEDQGKIEVYFSNIDKETQNKILSGLKSNLNATEDDTIAEQKIVEQLSKAPLFITMADEVQRQLQIKI